MISGSGDTKDAAAGVEDSGVEDSGVGVVSPNLANNEADLFTPEIHFDIHRTTSTPTRRTDRNQYQHHHEPPLSPSSAWRSASQPGFQGAVLGHGAMPMHLHGAGGAMRSRSNGIGGRGSVVVPGYSSCVVVLGFLRTMDGSLTEALSLRLDTAYEVWDQLSKRAGEPQAVLVTGGDIQKLGETEADAM